MHVIYVDDEKPARENFRLTVADFKDIETLQLFERGEQAVLWAKEHKVDAAFLDIEMSGLHGIELAKELTAMNENICIVFVTAYSQYALEAFKVDAVGYILKPYSKEEVRKELDKVQRMRPLPEKRIEITTIPSFSVLVDGVILKISNAKAKELFALLVDRAGSGITGSEVISYLWPDRASDVNTQSLYRMTLKRLMDVLREVGVEKIIETSGREKYLVTELVECDLYRILEGNKDAARCYAGEYMREYSWAETRNAQLSSMLKHGEN